jgi:tetratricopeptide (TPR) repeat protein
MRIRKSVAAAVMVLVIGSLGGRLCAADETSDSGPALAVRLTELAQRILRGESAPSDAAMRQAEALLIAATKCDPKEPRYWRLLADAQINLHDNAGALETLTTLRKLIPDDQVAQLEFIDLWVDRFQTVDQKLDYLRGLLSLDVIAPEIRSAAAWRCATLLNEKRQTSDVDAMVKQALTLNPLNWQALYYQYQQATANGSQIERFNALLALMRSNPCHPELILEIARELASAGLVTESLKWYNYGGTAWQRGRQVPPIPVIIEVASEFFVADQMQQAQPILDQIIEKQPENYPALVLRLLIEKNGGTREAANKLRVQARNALVNDVAEARQKLRVKEATTRPVNEGNELPPPDLGGDIDRVKNVEDAQLRDSYLQVLGNLAWFELYFNGKTIEAERLLGVIRQVSDPTDQQAKTFIARMEGWLFLLQPNKADEAKVKLSAAAEKDPFAALGLVRVYDIEDKAKAKAEATKLLGKYSSGMVGALLFHDVRELGAKVGPKPEAAALNVALANFPKDWMRAVDAPQQFYILRGEPMKISSPYGEPIMVRVAIQNISNHDLTIGDEGLIKPGLWFDVQLTGLVQKTLTGVAYERLTDRLLLKAHETIIRTVRVDQSGLAVFLSQTPGPPIAMHVTVRTNPIPGSGSITSGAGGQAQELGKAMERGAFPPTEANMAQAVNLSQTGDAREKLRSLEVLTMLGMVLRNQKDQPPEVKAKGESLIEAVKKARFDSDPNIRAWAGLLFAFSGSEEERAPNVQRMLLDDAWQSRLLGLAAMANLPRERQVQLAHEVLEKDSQQFVKDFAKATIEKPLPKPTTQPAQPAQN